MLCQRYKFVSLNAYPCRVVRLFSSIPACSSPLTTLFWSRWIQSLRWKQQPVYPIFLLVCFGMWEETKHMENIQNMLCSIRAFYPAHLLVVLFKRVFPLQGSPTYKTWFTCFHPETCGSFNFKPPVDDKFHTAKCKSCAESRQENETCYKKKNLYVDKLPTLN